MQSLLAMTPSELHVARLAATGLSNHAIALERGTSVRTVANQMAKLLRDLRVPSRRCLAALDGVAPPVEEAATHDWGMLERREFRVVARVCAGTPQKCVAIELGLSASSISRLLRRIRVRLGLGSFAELARAFRAACAADAAGAPVVDT